MNILFSINEYDSDGTVLEKGVFLHFGDARFKVADDPREFADFREQIELMEYEIRTGKPLDDRKRQALLRRHLHRHLVALASVVRGVLGEQPCPGCAGAIRMLGNKHALGCSIGAALDAANE